MIRYLDLAQYLWLAEQVTGVEATVLAKASRTDLADSALHALSASFGGDEFYPDIFDKAAVLACRLASNHPLVDGNKRAAWAAMVLFIDINGGTWDPDPPDVDDAEQAMLAVAAHEVDEAGLATPRTDRQPASCSACRRGRHDPGRRGPSDPRLTGRLCPPPGGRADLTTNQRRGRGVRSWACISEASASR